MSPLVTDMPSGADFLAILPELVLLGGGVLLLVVEMISPRNRRASAAVAILTMVAALAALAAPWQLAAEAGGVPFLIDGNNPAHERLLHFHGMIVSDGLSLAFKALLLTGGLIVMLMSARYGDRFRNPAEFFCLLVFATLASLLLAASSDLLMLYLSLEFLSIGSYVLVGYLKFQPRSAEASIKYFLYGAITAAVMLYGISLIYGLTGTTNLYPVATVADREGSVQAGLAALADTARPAILVAAGLVLVGFGFKASIVPFHQWAPDVYEGSPTPVMAWLSVVSKAAGFAVLIRVFIALFPAHEWVLPLAMLAAVTMLVGNLAAIGQTNIKRLLAYSSIGHAGFVLMGVAAWGQMTAHGLPVEPWQLYGALVYLAVYVFMNLGALAVVMAFYEGNRTHEIDEYAGLAQRSPVLAWLMVFFLLSLGGIPPTAGFLGKFLVFGAAIRAPDLWWLAVVGLVATVISVFYYLRIAQAMFLRPAKRPAMGRTDSGLRTALWIAAGATALIFFFAGGVLSLIQTHLPP